MYMKTQNFCQPIFYMQTAEKVLQGSQNPKKLDLKKKALKTNYCVSMNVFVLVIYIHC